MSTLTQELETLRDWLRYAVSRFNVTGLSYGHGTTAAFDEAAYLLLHTLHLPLDRLEPFLDAKLTHAEREQVQDIISRRVNERIPAAYLTHEAWLGEHRFYVDERVLIPRSYIAELLRDGLSPWISEPDRIQTALDLCTGSGCLAILIAHHFPNADVDAADISSDALAVALRNVADHGLQGRVNLIRSDLLSNLTEKN
jgi:ribosomal protein L3 glutamine methyltransferase